MTLASRVNDLAVAVREKFNAIFPKLVPEGGTAQQALIKNGTANHDVSWGNVWTPTNDGSGSGLNADLLDGDHGSAFAKLSGATFTGGITATGFTGPGGGLTGVNAASLGGQSANAYALLSGATFTGTVEAAAFDGDGSLVTGVNADSLDGFDSSDFARIGTDVTLKSIVVTDADNAISWENGAHWINGNDGGGNAQIRFGHNHGALNGGGTDEVFTHGGTAFYIGGAVDAGAGTLQMKIATNGGAGVGEAVTWGATTTITTTGVSIGGDLTVTGDVVGALTVPNGLGIGGASPDTTNTFAFYGTDLLLNSGGSINLKYNKSGSGDDASLTFQQGFTTYGLFGLLGNNDVTLKVGTGFNTALVASGADGTVSFPEGVRHDTVHAYKTSSQTLSGSYATLTGWDGTHVAASGNLSWNSTNGDAYVGKSGRFLVSYSVSTEISSGSGRTDSLAVLQRWNGSAWSNVEGSEHRMYNRLAGRGGSNASWTGVLDLSGSNGLRVAARVENGSDTVFVDSASLNISRL